MEKQATLPYGKYVMVWFGLLALTGLTVTAASLHFGKWSVLAAIIIATVKSSLVVLYFMNIKYEERIFKIMLAVAILTLMVIMILTFADTLFR
jgi:cytochrome c oxidase subunit 4